MSTILEPAQPSPVAPAATAGSPSARPVPPTTLCLAGLVALVLGVGAARELASGSVGPFTMAGGAIVAGAVVLLAFVRFPLFVLFSVGIRSAIDVSTGYADKLGVSPGAGLALLLTVSGLWWLFATRGPALAPVGRMRRAVLWFAGACLLSVIAAHSPIVSLKFLGKMASAIVLLAVLERLLVAPVFRRHLLLAVLISGVAPVLVALVQSVTGSGRLVDQGISRITGTFVHSNPLSLFLTFLLVLATAVLPHVRGLRRIGLALLLGGAGLALVLTYTRSAWIAAVIGLVAVGILQQRAVLAVVAILVVAGAVLVPQVSSRVTNIETQRFDSGEASNSVSWRFDYWTETLALGRRSPIVGIGIDQVRTLTEAGQPPHNDFLRSAVEAGVAGLVAYLGMLIAFGRALGGSYRRTVPGNLDRGVVVGAIGCFASFVMFSISGNVISQTVLLWYILVIVALGASVRGRSLSRP